MNHHDTVRTVIAARACSAARGRRRPATPIELACRVLPGFKIVPTTALLADVIADAVDNPDRRYVVSCPPRSGKSLMGSVIGPLYALMKDPDGTVVLKTYGDSLSLEFSGQARKIAAQHSAILGFELDADKTATDRWKVAGRSGGLLAGGVASPTVGFGASSLLVVDDPVKSSSDADSPALRRRLLAAFRSDLMSRLHPGASCLVLASRYHPEDLSGSLLAEPGGKWLAVNLPAIATAGVPDAFARPPGTPLVSVLGRDRAGFEEIRRAVGERAWAALYLGVPSTLSGSLIRREWLDDHRAPAAPAAPSAIVICVDPAEGGSATGDKTGIVAAALGRDRRVYLISDVSAVLTSDAWSNRAVELAITLGGSAIHVEAFNSGVTFVRLLNEAVARAAPPHRISVAPWPPKGSGRGRGDAVSRAAGMLAALENGSCVIGGFLPGLEADMVGWQAGQHCPDSVSAATICFDVLVHAAGRECAIIAPTAATLRAPKSRLLAAIQAREDRLAPPAPTAVPTEILLRRRLSATPGRGGMIRGRDRYRGW